MTRGLVRAVALVTAVASLSAAGCASRRDRLGKGDDVGFCVAGSEWEGLEAPDPKDRAELLDWAVATQNIIERIDLRQDVGERRPPARLGRTLVAVDKDMAAFETAVEAADTDEELLRAAARLSGRGFDTRADFLTQVKDQGCTAEERSA